MAESLRSSVARFNVARYVALLRPFITVFQKKWRALVIRVIITILMVKLFSLNPDMF